MKLEYAKPQVVKVNLKVEQTVLLPCKITGQTGPSGMNCQVPGEACASLSHPS